MVGCCDSAAPAGIGRPLSAFSGDAGLTFMPDGVSAAFATRKSFTSTSSSLPSWGRTLARSCWACARSAAACSGLPSMRACFALSILSDTRTAASTDSARSLKSTFETGHSALSGSAVAEPIVTPPPTSTRNAAAAATGTRWRARAERGALRGRWHARLDRGDGRLEVDQLGDRLVHDVGAPGGQQRHDLVVGVERTARRSARRSPRPSALISSSSAWTAARSTGSSSGVPWMKEPLP